MTIDSSPALDWAHLGQAFADAHAQMDGNDYLAADHGAESIEPPTDLSVVDAEEREDADVLRSVWLQDVEDVRDFFPHEAHDFTPWVAENLHRVESAAGMDKPLTLVATEQKIGGYRIDVLAKTEVDGRDRFVVIENQLERTDADHLGRLISCAAEVKASYAIWISTHFRDEHLKVIEALQRSYAECAFVPLLIDGARTGKDLANFQLVNPPTYASPDDYLREKLWSCVRQAEGNYRTFQRVWGLMEEHQDVDFSRYRHLIEEAGYWSCKTDATIDLLLEEVPTARRTRSVTPA